MPLKKSRSKKAVAYNMDELMHGPVGPARKKALKTMMKKGMTMKQARMKQAEAIALNMGKKKKKKR